MNLLKYIILLLVLLAPVSGWAQVPPGASNPAGCAYAQGIGGGSFEVRYTQGLGVVGSAIGVDWYLPTARRPVCPCSPGLWIERFVHCFTAEEHGVIYKAVMNFIRGVRPYYQTIFGAAIMLATVMFGIKLMSGGVRMLPRESFVLAFKIAGVLMFLANFELIYQQLIRATYGLGNMVAELTAGFGDICGHGSSAGASSVPSLWAQFDCVFKNLLGISVHNEALILGVSALVTAMVLSGGILAGAAIGIIFILFTLILAAMRMVFTYVATILSISFLMLLGPIFVPLVLFSSRIDQFKKWVVMILMHLFVPMFLYLIMVLVLVLLEYSIFVGPTSLIGAFTSSPPTKSQEFARTVPPSSLYMNQDVDVLTNKLDSSTYSSNPSAGATSTAGGENRPTSTTAPTSNSTYESQASVFTINKSAAAANAGKTEDAWLADLIAKVLGALILAYISYTLLSSAPQIVNKMVAQGVNGQFVTQGQMLGQGGIEKAQAGLSQVQQKSSQAREKNKAVDGSSSLMSGEKSEIVSQVVKAAIDAETGGMGGAAMDAAGKAGESSSKGGGGSEGKGNSDEPVKKGGGATAQAAGGDASGLKGATDTVKKAATDAAKKAVDAETGGMGGAAVDAAAKAGEGKGKDKK